MSVMDTQQTVVLAIVLTAAVFLSRRAWRSYRAARMPKTGCGDDCGCGH